MALLLAGAVAGPALAADEPAVQSPWFATGLFDEQHDFESSKVSFRFDGHMLTGSGYLAAGDRHRDGEWSRVDITFTTDANPDMGQSGCYSGMATLHHTGARILGADVVDHDSSDQDAWEACSDEGILKGRLHDVDLSFQAEQIEGEDLRGLIDEVRRSAVAVEPGAGPTVEPASAAATLVPPATATPPEPTPGSELASGDPTQDLWFHQGDTVTRVDHMSGEILGRWDVSHPGCPTGRGSQPIVQSDGEAVWLTIVDAQWEAPVLECLIRLPLDGSEELETYPVPVGRKPTFVNDVAAHGRDLWAVAWRKAGPQATLEYYADWSLSRLDRWAGGLVEVLPRVVALAPSEVGLVVLYSGRSAKGGARRPLQLGIVEPGGIAPREIPFDGALPRTKKGAYVTPRLRLSAGREGSIALFDEFAKRKIVVFDPASGAIIGRVSPPDGATALGSVWPVSDGVWMTGLLEDRYDFGRFIPFDGGKALEFACSAAATDCYSRVETASDGGAWLSAWPFDDAFEIDLDRVVLRRYDTGGQLLAEVTGEALFSTG